MNTRGRQAQRRASAAVNIRLCFYVCSGLQQQLRDLHDILRCLLPVSFDTVCRCVMKKRRAMLACRVLLRQRRILPEKSPERLYIARDDCIGRCLELRHRLDVFDQPGPAHEPVRTSNHKLCIGQRACAFVREHSPYGEFRNFINPRLNSHGKARGDFRAAQAGKIADPLRCPFA